MSEALTRTVDGKVDLSWEDLELPGHPEGAGTVRKQDCSWEPNC